MLKSLKTSGIVEFLFQIELFNLLLRIYLRTICLLLSAAITHRVRKIIFIINISIEIR